MSCSTIKAVKKKRSAEQLCLEHSSIGNKRARFEAVQSGLCDDVTADLAEKHTVDEVNGPPNNYSNGRHQPTRSKPGSSKVACWTDPSTRSSTLASKIKDVATRDGDDTSVENEDDFASPDNDGGRITDKPDEQGPSLTAKPLSNLREIIQHLLEASQRDGLKHFVDAGQHYIRVGTLCSGTDAPLHVMNLFGMLKNENGEQVFTTVNVFGCEIEPFKQGFLLRNSKPQLLFRDARDFASNGAQKA